MNLIFLYGSNNDFLFEDQEHIFLGAGKDSSNVEVHIFLKKDEKLYGNTSTSIYKRNGFRY